MLKFIFSLMLLSANMGFAASNVVSLINSNGDLVISIVDHPSEPPYEGGLLWSLVAGGENNKQIKTDEFSFVCQTLLSKPQNERFGSCRMVVSQKKVSHGEGYYGTILTDEGIISKTVESNLSLVNGKILVTADHQQKAVGIKIDESLVEHP